MPPRFKPQTYGYPVGVQTPTPAPIIAQRAPTTSDLGYPVGQTWIDQTGNASYIFIETINNQASWATSSLSAGTVATLTGNGGGAISPSGAGNISIVGTATNGINVSGAGNTLTASMQSPYGTGSFDFSRAAVGSVNQLAVVNSDNTNPASHSRFVMQVGGASAGDPQAIWEISGALAYYAGIDNTDDFWKFGTGSAIGTNTRLQFNAAGNGIWTHFADSMQFDGVSTGFASSEYVQQQAGVQIAAATTATVHSITLADPQTITVVWTFSASLNPATEAGGGTVTATARRSGGGAVLLGVPVIAYNSDFAGADSVTADVSGNDIRLRFTTGTNGPVNIIAHASFQPLVSNA